MDEDGLQKEKITGYGGVSDSEMDGSAEQAEQDQDSEVDEAQPLSKEVLKHSGIFKEKHAKYLQYLKGDFIFEQHKSATVTLQFPLEYKKLLLLSLVDTVIKKVVVRSVAGVDRCVLIEPGKGQDAYLFVQG